MKIKKYLPAFIDFEREVPAQEFSAEKILEVDFVKSVYDMSSFRHFHMHADALVAHLKDKTCFVVGLISREDDEKLINCVIIKGIDSFSIIQ